MQRCASESFNRQGFLDGLKSRGRVEQISTPLAEDRGQNIMIFLNQERVGARFNLGDGSIELGLLAIMRMKMKIWSVRPHEQREATWIPAPPLSPMPARVVRSLRLLVESPGWRTLESKA